MSIAILAAGALAAALVGCGAEEAGMASDNPTRRADESVGDGREQATFAAGCFWGVEETFRQTPGVVETSVGYTGGHAESPTYKQVCAGNTGHAEAVRVIYDPSEVSYDRLLEVFWESHDPTQRNRQGPDVGSQYRSAIFYHDESQREAAEASRERAQERFRRPIATEITPAGAFWQAEEYHQQYLRKRNAGSCHF